MLCLLPLSSPVLHPEEDLFAAVPWKDDGLGEEQLPVCKSPAHCWMFPSWGRSLGPVVRMWPRLSQAPAVPGYLGWDPAALSLLTHTVSGGSIDGNSSYLWY